MQSAVYIIIGFIVLMLLTLALTGWLKSISIRNNWFDWPTERGSHQNPVPNIGGLGIAVTVFAVIIGLGLLGKLSFSKVFLWLFVVCVLGIVGFIDDIKDLSKRLRLCVHMIVAVVAVYLCGGINQLDLGFTVIKFGIVAYLLGFIWVVWFINMYNFMDGINGLAGAQAFITGLVFALWFYLFGEPGESVILLSIAAASAGFLYWNMTPARVFMGDSGSTMLGGLFAVVCLLLHNNQQLPIILPALIFTWFLLDTSVTLVRRLLKGENIWQAHRQHFYQKLALRPEDHTKVTGMISLLTLIISIVITMVLFKQSYV